MDKVPVNVSSFTDKQVIDSCCAWGACIETTLLTDLSEEERSRLAEHCLTCSACARRFQKYEIIEAFAGEILLYDLHRSSRYPLGIRAIQQERKRKEVICKTIIYKIIISLARTVTRRAH